MTGTGKPPKLVNIGSGGWVDPWAVSRVSTSVDTEETFLHMALDGKDWYFKTDMSETDVVKRINAVRGPVKETRE